MSDGKRLWETPGGGGGLFAKPEIIGTTLLQLFSDSGAITVTNLYGFDVRTGHARWVRRSNIEPLGVQGRNLYVDSTWFASQLDNYVPLTVSRIDTANGAVLATYTYTPDPERHAHPPGEGPGRATGAHVAGGFVYLLVRGRVDVTMLGPSDRVVVPDDVVADRHGTVWFNDAGAPLVASLDRSGRIAWHSGRSAGTSGCDPDRCAVPDRDERRAAHDATAWTGNSPRDRPGRRGMVRATASGTNHRARRRERIVPDPGRLWFAAGSNAPDQQIGTLELHPRP